MRKQKKTAYTPAPAAPKPEPTSMEKILWARREIEWTLDYELKRCRETKAEFIAAVNKNDPADLDLDYLVKRCAEDVFLASVKEREVLDLLKFYTVSIDDKEGGVEHVLNLLRKEQTGKVSRLLESPYRRNSTCAVSNFHQECELRAQAEFWKPAGGFGHGTVQQIMVSLETWLKAEADLLSDYEVVDNVSI